MSYLTQKHDVLCHYITVIQSISRQKSNSVLFFSFNCSKDFDALLFMFSHKLHLMKLRLICL